jgi:hypothetical protein
VKKRTALVLVGAMCLFLLPPSTVSAAEAVELTRAETAPKIDGVLDDPVWQLAPKWSDFKTIKPDYGKAVSEKTDVYVAYDREHLYVAFNCLDGNPAGIKTSTARRDSIDSDDWVAVVLDTFDDQQSGYLFVLNPSGIQGDGILNQDGNGNFDYDMVWESAGKVNGKGFTTEMAIPFKSLRYPFRKVLTMGFGAARVIVRKSEQAHFPEFNPDRGSMLAQFQRITLSDIKYQRNYELLPAVTFSQNHAHSGGSWQRDSRQFDFSLTGKLGITSDLTLDASYNPDFSQVESDAGQIDFNLRSSLYYSEKRPFFLEGKENFAMAAPMEQDPLYAVVHTRTIVDPVLGFKLTGKVGRRDMLSSIFALDEFPGQVASEEGDEERTGRNAVFTVFRYKRSLRGDSFLGGFYTGREFAGSFNRLLGADGRFRLTPASTLEFHAFGSLSRSGSGADSLGGSAVGLRYNYSTRKWYMEFGFNDISRNFRTDIGYVSRVGLTTLPWLVIRSLYPRSKFFQRIEPFYWGYLARDRFSGLNETANVFVLRFFMPRQSQLRFDAIVGSEVFADQRFSITAWRVLGYTQILKQLYLEASVRRGGMIFYDPDAPFQGRGTRSSFYLTFQPTEKLNNSVSVEFTDFFRKADGEKVYDYTIVRDRLTFQFNKYLFLRGIIEYNTYYKKLTADLLASFTYIPGTVIYVGYGSAYDKLRWDEGERDYLPADDFLRTRGSFFFKASYLWRF